MVKKDGKGAVTEDGNGASIGKDTTEEAVEIRPRQDHNELLQRFVRSVMY